MVTGAHPLKNGLVPAQRQKLCSREPNFDLAYAAVDGANLSYKSFL